MNKSNYCSESFKAGYEKALEDLNAAQQIVLRNMSLTLSNHSEAQTAAPRRVYETQH